MARRLEIEVVGDTRSLERALGRAGKSTGRFGSKFGLLKGAGVAAGAGIGIAVVALGKAVQAAKEAEVSDAKMKAQLDALGISYEKHRDKIDRTITAHSKLSAFDDEDLQDSFTNIVRVTGDVNEALRLNALAADFARAKGMDVAKAGELIGKVAGGNIGILSRYGIAMKKGATSTEALGVLQQKFGGQAKAYGDSTAGAQEKFQVALENLQETIGQKVLPVLARLMVALVEAVEWVQAHWPEISAEIEKFWVKVEPVLQGFADLAVEIVKTIQEHWGTIGPIVKRVGDMIETAVKIITDALQLVTALLRGDWAEAWKELKSLVGNMLQQVANIVGLFAHILIAALKKLGTEMKNALVAGLEGIGNAAWAVIDNIGEAIANQAEAIANWGRGIANGIKNAVVNTLVGIGNAAWQIVNNIGERIAEMAETILGWGRFIGTAIKSALVGENGLLGIGAAAWGVINNIGSFLQDVKKEIMGWGRAIGNWIIDGILAALEGLGGAVWDAIKGGAGSVLDRLPGRGQGGGGGGGSSGGGRGGDAGIEGTIAAANVIDAQNFPYLWGGGHTADTFGGPYDCSGAVSAILRAGGFMAGSLVSGQFMNWGASGPGRKISIYANPEHVYALINGKAWGTSGQNPGGGAGWFSGGPRAGFTVRHPPGFDLGGVVPGTGPQLIMAHGGETVLPTHRGGGLPIQVNLNVDGTTLARVLVDPLRREARMFERSNGRSAF